MIASTERWAAVEFRLVPSQRLAGRVVDAAGKPVAGASVLVVTPGNYLEVDGGVPSRGEPLPPDDGTRSAKTAADGRFEVSVDCERCRLVALGDAGFADVTADEVLGGTKNAGAKNAGAKSGNAREVRLRRWGTVACSAVLDGKPAAGLRMNAERVDESRGGTEDAYVEYNTTGVTGADGRCTLARVVPGHTIVAVRDRQDFGPRDSNFGSPFVRQTPIEVSEGETTAVHTGGGSVVTGRFTSGGRDVPWRYALARLYHGVDDPAPTTRPLDWRETAIAQREIPVEVRPDGTFRATDVPPGGWSFDSIIFLERRNALPADTPAGAAAGGPRLRKAGDTPKRFIVPGPTTRPGGPATSPSTAPASDPPSGPSSAPTVDLGEVPVRFLNLIDEGDAAPHFEVTTLDGKKLRLSDFRGKYVVLDFWATWCGPCRAELPFLKASWESLKNDPGVAFLGLSIDASDVPVRPFVAERGYGWAQAVLGESSKIATQYGIDTIPHVWMVLPDGTLAAAHADGLAELIAARRKAAAGPQTRPATRPG